MRGPDRDNRVLDGLGYNSVVQRWTEAARLKQHTAPVRSGARRRLCGAGVDHGRKQ